MKNLFKKSFATVLVLVLLVAPGMSLIASEPAARNISVFRVEGNDARLARTFGGNTTTPRDGQRLSVGNVMTTGHDTQVYMQLDTASIMKMDEESQVAVGSAGNLLSLSVFYGSALVDAARQTSGQSLETRIGNITTGVRGTLFIAGIRENGAVVVTMLSGEGAINVHDGTGRVVEMPLAAGYAFWMDERADAAVRPLDLDTMSLFELQEAYSRGEYLVQIGTITPEMLERMPQLIETRLSERDAKRAAEAQALAEMIAGANVTIFATAQAEQAVDQHEPEILQRILPSSPNHPMVGQTILFGGGLEFGAPLPQNWLRNAERYNGNVWQVLDVQDNRMLIVSRFILDFRPYHSAGGPVTWETSEIRQFLNSDFLGRFSPEEQALIAMTTVVNNNNPEFGTPGGNDTQDRIFLLSVEEVLRYFYDTEGVLQFGIDPERINILAYGVFLHDGMWDVIGPWGWWLRSPGRSSYNAILVVNFDMIGMISIGGECVTIGTHIAADESGMSGIRPAMWIYLDTVHAAPAQPDPHVNLVAAGYGHSLAIIDGNLYAWGDNSFGQLGDGTTVSRHIPVRVMDDVVSVAASNHSSFAIRADGSLWAWGFRHPDHILSPIRLMDDVSLITSGSSLPVLIRDDRSMWWSLWQLPMRITNWYDIVYVATSQEVLDLNDQPMTYIIVIREDGSLWHLSHQAYEQWNATMLMEGGVAYVSQAYFGRVKTEDGQWLEFPRTWGVSADMRSVDIEQMPLYLNIDGEIARSNANLSNMRAVLSQSGELRWQSGIIATRDAGYHWDYIWTMHNVVCFSVSPSHLLAILDDGSVMAWGMNSHGQLGVASTGNDCSHLTPVLVEFR